MQSNPILAITEAVLKSILQEIGPKNFAIALHNASVHGDVFKENFDEHLVPVETPKTYEASTNKPLLLLYIRQQYPNDKVLKALVESL